MEKEIKEIDSLLFEVHTYLNKVLLNSNDTDIKEADLEELEDIEEKMDRARTKLAFLKRGSKE